MLFEVYMRESVIMNTPKSFQKINVKKKVKYFCNFEIELC